MSRDNCPDRSTLDRIYYQHREDFEAWLNSTSVNGSAQPMEIHVRLCQHCRRDLLTILKIDQADIAGAVEENYLALG